MVVYHWVIFARLKSLLLICIISREANLNSNSFFTTESYDPGPVRRRSEKTFDHNSHVHWGFWDGSQVLSKKWTCNNFWRHLPWYYPNCHPCWCWIEHLYVGVCTRVELGMMSPAVQDQRMNRVATTSFHESAWTGDFTSIFSNSASVMKCSWSFPLERL